MMQANDAMPVDSRFGGLLFFYGADGKRYMSDVGGVLVPIFI